MLMIRKVVVLLIAILWGGVTSILSAQNKQVSGTITGTDGQPLVGVTVLIEGSSAGTTSGIDGKYTISVPANASLAFSFIGYQPQTIAVGNSTTVDATLQEDAQAIDDVIVVAYGTASKSAFTGSATQVKGDDISKMSKESIDKGMVGKISGVRVSSDNGDPGSAGNIQIRGVGSISASTTPLYVIDGVVMGATSNDLVLPTGTYKSTSILNTLNPDDIESITILKDAAAASLYGSRAANGVVVITTKRGKAGKTQISYTGEFGVSSRANTKAYEMMDGKQFIQYLKDAADNAYAINPAYSSNKTGDEWAAMVADPTGATSTNWTNEIFRNAFSHNHQVSLTAGGEKTRVYAGLGYNKADGIVLGSHFERFSGRVNVDHDVNKWLKLSLRQMISFTDNKGHSDQSDQAQGMGYATPIGVLGQSDPTARPKNPDGSWNEDVSWSGYTSNPHILFDSDLEYNRFHTMRSLSNFDINIRLSDKLSLTNTFGYDYMDNKQTLWWAPSSIDGQSYNGLSAKYVYQTSDITNSTILRYTDTFGASHHLSAMAGFELSDHKREFIYAATSNFPNDKLPALSVGQVYGASGKNDRSFMLSMLASASYDFAHKYYLSASWRRDGSSRLGKDNRWANFYSVSGAWRLSEEEFLKGSDLFTDFKVKASYGTNGNLPSAYYAYQGVYGADGGYGNGSAIFWNNPDNQVLGWEKSENFNVGFNWNLYGRVQLGVEYYNKLTSSLLFEMPSSVVTGFKKYMANIGNLKNNGIEVEIGSQNIRKKNFTWTTDFNFTWQRSIVTELPNNGADISYGDGNMYLHRQGESMYTFYLPQWKGVNPDTGLGEFWIDPDDHSKGVTNYYSEAGNGIVGKAIPDFIGGMTNTFTFGKHFDLSLLLSYQFGGDMFDYPSYFMLSDGFRAAMMNSLAEGADYWTPQNRDAKYPKPIMGNPYRSDRFSSRLIKSTDNIRMREITLGYNIPVKRYFDKLRVYFKTTNPFMIWSATPEIDPDVPINGYRTADVPVTRSFVFGLNMTF